MTAATITTPATSPAPLDAEQLALVQACQEAKGKRDQALEAAQAKFSTDVAKANRDFAAVVTRAQRRVKTNRLASAIGINRQNLHRILSEHGPKK
jgi:phage antirepressor YoqD-like protein